uniref:AD domain-containing protein n=1 Tax=Meloidogyne javanica TaxID=6303 RepID=A0A915LP46_MELJA
MEQITKNFNNGENDVANDSQADLESLNAVKCDVWPTTSVQCQNDSFSIGDFIRCSTKSSHFSGELIINDVTNGILLLEEYLNNGRSTLHFVKKCGLLTIEKMFSPQKMQKRRSSNLIKHNNSLYTIDEIERTENVLEIDYLIKDEQAKRTFLELKRIFDDVIWDGSNILVLKCIRVFHPYDFKSIEIIDSRSSSLEAFTRVQKILEMRRDCRTIPSLLSLNFSLMDVCAPGTSQQLTTEASQGENV